MTERTQQNSSKEITELYKPGHRFGIILCVLKMAQSI